MLSLSDIFMEMDELNADFKNLTAVSETTVPNMRLTPLQIKTKYVVSSAGAGQINVTWTDAQSNCKRHSRTVGYDHSARDRHAAAICEVLGVTPDVLIEGGTGDTATREWFLCGCSTNGKRSSHWDACINSEPADGKVRA
jgi:hypothetical protein